MTSPQPALSIVIPAYQEAAIIESSLESLASYLRKYPFTSVEVIIVVADSPDGTAELSASKAHLFDSFQIIRPGSRVGKGRDVRAGMLAATGSFRLFMDADLATPLVHLEDVHKLMQHNSQVGVAVRDLLRIHHGYSRKVMSKLANIAAQILVVPGIPDTQCGFKVFSAEATEAIFSRQTMLKWSFDMELLGIAHYLDYSIDTFDAPDWADPKPANSGLSGDSMYRIMLAGFLDPLKIRLNIWRGIYRR